MKYRIALIRSDEGYAASVPGMPGCWSQGATIEEALENIRSAIAEYQLVIGQLLGQADEVREIEVVN